MIYIVAHNKVDFNNLYVDETFDSNMYKFFLTEGRINKKDITKVIESEGFGIEMEWKLDKYNPKLQKYNFHAPSIFYHTYLNNFKFDGTYIGFLEYDLQLTSNFSANIKEIVEKHSDNSFLIFPSIRHKLTRLDNQNTISMLGKSWLKFFLIDYNKRYNTSYEYSKFIKDHGNELIPTQQSFICDVDTYKLVSKYVYDFISDYPDRSQYSSLPGTILERYIGIFLYILSLKCKNVYRIPLQHKHSSGGRY